MTVAVGLVCLDGVVVAADSMSSSGGTARPGLKVNAMEHVPAVWTASGSVYVIEEVRQSLDELDELAKTNDIVKNTFVSPDLNAVRQNLSSSVRDAMKQSYGKIMPGFGLVATPRGNVHPWSTSFLMLGFSNNTPYFLEIASDGQLNWHTQPRFYAVGSGGDFAFVAQALMEHYVDGNLTVDLGLMIAARTIETTCRVSTAHVGLPVQLAKATAEGASVLTSDEVDDVMQQVEGWLTLEKETLKTTSKPEPAIEEPPKFEGDDQEGTGGEPRKGDAPTE